MYGYDFKFINLSNFFLRAPRVMLLLIFLTV